MGIVIAILLFLILLAIAPDMVIQIVGTLLGLALWALVIGGLVILVLVGG